MTSPLRLLVASALVALIFLRPCGASAATALGDVIVFVVDREGSPVAAAAVFVLGTTIDTNRAGTTGPDGTFSAELLRQGTYRVVVRGKERESVTASIDIQPDRIVRVRIVLGEPLRVIGRTRSAPSPATVSVDAISPAGRLSRSFIDAVTELSGVNVTYDARGSANGLSIRGRDPSQTRYTFNGAAIIDPLRSHLVDPDVVQSARIDSNLDMVSFTTLSPTSQPTYSVTETFGGSGEYVERGTAQATIGATGIAAAAIRRNARSALDGATFQDTSGSSYVHRGDFAGTSGYLSVVANLGRFWRATASEVGNAGWSHPVATYFAGPVPYGYGGSVSTRMRASTTVVNTSGALPGALIGISMSAGSGSTIDDQRNRITSGVSDPEYASSSSNFVSLDVDAIVPRPNEPHLHVTALREARTQLIGTSPLSAALDATTYARASAAFGERFHLGPVSSVDLEAGLAGGTNAPTAPVGAAAFSLHSGGGSFSARYAAGAEVPPDLGSAALSRVGDASYDCGASAIRISGPSDPVRPVRSRKLAIDASRGDGERSVGLSLYDEHYRGTGLADAIVPATLERPGYLPPGYLDAIAGGWSSAGKCPGSFTDSSRIFLSQGITGLRVAYRGITVRARDHIGRFSVEGFVDVSAATLDDDSGRLTAPTSVYISGRQLPGIPTSKIGATFGWVGPTGQTQLLLNATRTGKNNANRLPAYTLVTAGFERRLSASSSLDVVFTNVGGAYVSDFTSPRYAVPLATRSGEGLTFVAAPLRVPSLYLKLRTTLAH